MTTDARYLAAAAILAWVMLMLAAALRTRLWTPKGIVLGLGNREEVPEPTALAGRADRAARNMLENLVLLVALFVAARAAGVSAERLEKPTAIFFWARLGYFPVYLAGIPYLRTALWAVGAVALGTIASELL